MTESVGVDGGEEGGLLHHRVEFQNGTRRLQVAVTHDGALFIDDGFRTATFRIVAVVNGSVRPRGFIGVIRSAGPSTPVGVVGTEVVAKFVGHHKQVPREVGWNHGEVGLVVHGAAESAGKIGAANHAEVGDSAGASVASFGHEENHVPVGIGQNRIRRRPLHTQLVEHGARVVHGASPRFGHLPNVDVRRLQRDEVIELGPVHQVHTRQNAQAPIDGAVAIRKRVVSEVVNVQSNLHALGNQALLLLSTHQGHLTLLVFHRAGEGVGCRRFGHVKKHVVFHTCLAVSRSLGRSQFPLLSIQFEGSLHVIFKHHDNACDLGET